MAEVSPDILPNPLLAQPKVAIIAHDAGGAEILSSLVKQQSHWQPQFVLQGPAEKIFQRKLGPLSLSSLPDALAQADWLLTGTGWQSMLEWQAIKLAKQAGKPVAAFLDHWVNYRERFVRDEELVLPDQIWVGDDDACKLAQQIFPATPVYLHANPYFSEIQASFQQFPHRAQGLRENLLFVCEPIAEHAQKQFGNARHWGYTEFDALAHFLQNIEKIAPAARQITIRPHPSESADKYAALLGQYALPLQIGGKQDLKHEIAEADLVFGCNSMAMVIALLAGKTVYCCIPPGGPACTLPQKEILLLDRDQGSK